ncbi:hypothetical protein ACLOJK_003762, partial [Asimina triloba]
ACVPMKSRMIRPSLARPACRWKKVMPKGQGNWEKAADRPQVTEFEAPKLKIAGKLQPYSS